MSKVFLERAQLRQAREFLLAAETADKAGLTGPANTATGSDKEYTEAIELVGRGLNTLDEALANNEQEFSGTVAGTLVVSLQAALRILQDIPFADSKGIPETIEIIEKEALIQSK